MSFVYDAPPDVPTLVVVYLRPPVLRVLVDPSGEQIRDTVAFYKALVS